MPELPEVETIVRGLKKIIIGKLINNVIIREAKLIGYPDEEGFIEGIENREIIDIERRGKYILIRLNEEKTLVFHLRMTGKLLVKEREEIPDKHTHIIFELDNGLDLRFNNIRKFGRAYLIDGDNWQNAGGLSKLGPEPLSPYFTFDDFKNALKKRKTRIKALLLNQGFIAGLGNIYSDEALFRAGISPTRKADSLTDQEIAALYQAIRLILELGIEYGGTTFSDYLNAIGEKGKFQYQLQVYGRTGEDCLCCGQKIIRERVGGRNSHYCPHCQH